MEFRIIDHPDDVSMLSLIALYEKKPLALFPVAKTILHGFRLGHVYWVVEENGKVLGSIEIKMEKKGKKTFIRTFDTFVHPSFQRGKTPVRLHLGERLTLQLIDFAASRNISLIDKNGQSYAMTEMLEKLKREAPVFESGPQKGKKKVQYRIRRAFDGTSHTTIRLRRNR